MKLQIRDETKVGLLAAFTIALLIIGLNYLKGYSLFERKFMLNAWYQNIDGLRVGDQVLLNGLQVGQIRTIELNEEAGKIQVSFDVKHGIKVPADSKAMIYSTDFLGTKAMQILLGKSTTYLDHKDRITDSVQIGLIDRFSNELLPVKTKAESLIVEATKVLESFRGIVNEQERYQLKSIIANLQLITGNVAKSTGGLNNTMKKVDDMTKSAASILNNFEKNNEMITKIMTNTGKLTDSLAASSGEIQSTIRNANASLKQFTQIAEKINNGQGTIGMLLNNDSLYKNLNSSAKSLDDLLIDLREHPSRFVHFSLFGKKDKTSAKEKKR
ncbi:MAG: MlaD family protein [Bacteroidia bacterium]|nr:MlaD family protein [Bacteroidia bacterium]